jgi:replicative DNA helicase
MELPMLKQMIETGSTPAKIGLTAAMLFEPEGKKVYQFVTKFFSEHGQMPAMGTIEQETGVPISTIEAPEPIGYYLDLILKRNAKNQISDYLQKEVGKLAKESDPTTFFNGLRQTLQGIQQSSGKKYWDMQEEESRRKVLEAYEHIAKFKGKVIGIPTPWNAFNEMTGGLDVGHFVSIIARSETGKSWTMLKIGDHAHATVNEATGQPNKVIFISPEMSEEIVRFRLAAIHCKLSYNAFRKGMLTPHEKEKLVKFVETPISNSFIIADSSVIQTAQQVEMLVLEHRPQLVIVDSYFLLDLEGRFGSTNERREALTIALYQQAKRRKVPYIVSTHFTSKVTKDKKGDAEDVAYTKQAIRLADLALGLHRDEEMMQNKVMQLQILKNREGVKADILINFDLEQMAFDELQVQKASGEFGHIAPKNASDEPIKTEGGDLELGL